MSLQDIKQSRLEKIERLRSSGIDPYPSDSKRTHTIADAIASFSHLSEAHIPICIAGRVRAMREHGGSTFLDLEDGTGRIQGYVKEDRIGKEAYDFFLSVLDVGDFIDLSGTLFLTKKSEKTVDVLEWRMLAKSILPLPEKWHGLQDTEVRYRKRYLDIMFHPEVRELILIRARFWGAMRTCMEERGFLEVETPVLETTPGGADARPFITHHNALDLDVYLRISCGELWQKRLMVAGFPKVFEIGRIFRNEGMSAEHLQDYTQLEFYWAFANYRDGMQFVKELYCRVATETFDTLQFKTESGSFDLGAEWKEYDFRTLIQEKTGIDVLHTEISQVEAKLDELGVSYDMPQRNLPRLIDALWKHCRKDIMGPAFLVHVPVYMEPLAKRARDNPHTAERFQVILAGSEMGKGYSELNDPMDQQERLEEQQRMHDAGDDEAQMIDHDFIEALAYGMPPTCGFGVSERLFSVLAGMSSVREAQIFPLMRPK
ncbi:MAG: lysyl-tRNA synthetase [Parcubacteria group bacterium Gr01-1014_66]|nr:MAG: lysyl-tRNA synthetase [Parcubacteria group bacterium Gr01-1014_66]